MRIVAGSRKGHRIAAPRGVVTRPTGDRVREAAFSLIGPIDGATVLDLFAGTGALGIEALSRGAASATFVDADLHAVRAIRENLTVTGLGATARVVHADVFRFLADSLQPVDLAFADPPYAFTDWPRLLAVLPARLIAIEAATHVAMEPGWRALRSKRYGDTVVTLARVESPPEEQG